MRMMVVLPIACYYRFLRKCDLARPEHSILRNGVIIRDDRGAEVRIPCDFERARTLLELAKIIHPEAIAPLQESIEGSSPTVRLRDHPLMTRQSGFRNWPPVWATMRPGAPMTKGEIGMLKNASMHDLFVNRLYLFMEHQGRQYSSSMHFDDGRFCYALYTLLMSSIGRSIEAIAELELPYNL